MKNQKIPKELFKLNITFAAIAIVLHLILFSVFDNTKNINNVISVFINITLLLSYLYVLLGKVEKKLDLIKREVLYINYPVSILSFLLFISLIMLASSICLVCVNPEAANVTFIFTFFMTTISILMPTILFFVFMFFITPALIIPSFRTRKNQTKTKTIIVVLFVLLTLCALYGMITRFQLINNFDKQVVFKTSRLTVSYATDFLKIHNSISSRAKQLMSKDTVKVPFIYTSESYGFNDYASADRFCRAMDASVPNYLEAYHVVFNRFDTFGDKYYWTSDKDGLNNEYPLVLHYKNMSYEIIRKPDNVKPEVYCVAPSQNNYGLGDKKYFIRNLQKEHKETMQTMIAKPFNENILQDLSKVEDSQRQMLPPPSVPANETAVNKELKHVDFSVKEVPQEVFTQLSQKGYIYNPSISISQNYEINEALLSAKVRNTSNNIRLCYYPFMEFGEMGIFKEKEIWSQNFCSPAFDVINNKPDLKTRHEKDSYCFSKGGRLPNIAELGGILKSYGYNQPNVKYWTNIKVKDVASNSTLPVYVYYKDSRFMNVETVDPKSNEQAYAFCITKPKVPSSVIANYKSKFVNTDGNFYARQICPSCKYYEVPDVVLKQ